MNNVIQSKLKFFNLIKNLSVFLILLTAIFFIKINYSLADDSKEHTTEETSTNKKSETISSDKAQENPITAKDSDQKTKKTKFKLPDGLKWLTNDYDPEDADLNAVKGGIYRSYLKSYPPTFRQVGPNSNSGFRSFLDIFSLELTGINLNTLNRYPSLATHWSFAGDNKTVYFKLNKKAMWSDAKPVTADDYLFTMEFMRSKHIVAPSYNNYFTKEIVDIKKHDDYIISVVSGKAHPKDVLIARVNIGPTPKHFHKLDKDWVKNYNWKVSPVTGPYQLSSFKTGKYVVFKRKKDWWAKDMKYFRGKYNFDEIFLKVIRDDEAQWQAFLKGTVHNFSLSFDLYWTDKSKNEEAFKKGYIQKVLYYTKNTHGTNGLYLNAQDPLFKDINVRKAFAHALNFDLLISKLLKNKYTRIQSFYGGYGEYINKQVKARTLDLEKSASLMKASGWKLSEKSGYWMKDGKEAKIIILPYYSKKEIDWWLFLAEEAKKAGFHLIIDKKDQSTIYKSAMQKNFQALHVGYNISGDTTPPSYWQFFHSENAKKQTNNLSMISDKELDKLIDEYRDTFDTSKKQQLSQKILMKIHEKAYYIPWIYKPMARYGHWRYIKYPKKRGTKFAPHSSIKYAWFDEAAKAEYEKYKKEGKAFDDGLLIDTTYK